MKTVLFYWSKGADVRRHIVLALYDCAKKGKPCFTSELARKLRLSHVAILRHLELLEKEGYVVPLNPGGKPVFLGLSEKGQAVVHEFLP